ncbi:MAG: SDR family NAD(P)-dependent oxidoreductase [Candidatus Binatia bacterium]
MGERLKGRVAVVTGAGRGIGRATAELLAAEGAAVVVNDVGGDVGGSGATASVADEVVAAIRARGGTAVGNHDSVADFRAAERIVGTAVREFGRLDVLVNNAGILRDRMIFNMTEAEWDAVIAVHLKGTFNCTRHASAQMRTQKFGRIVLMSSTSGVFGNSGQANYGAAKDGIAAFTRVVARDLGRYGITANAVCPAAATRMIQTIPDTARQARTKGGIANPGGAPRPTMLAHMGPENVAPWIVYLTTDAAREVNGKVFLVMGGLVALLDDPSPVRTIQKDGRWTAEEIALLFPRTLGMDLVNPAPPQGPTTSA